MVEILSTKSFSHNAKDLNDAKLIARTLIKGGHTISSIGDDDVIDTCEKCGGPLLYGDDYQQDSEGITWHTNETDCLPAEKG